MLKREENYEKIINFNYMYNNYYDINNINFVEFKTGY